MATIAQGVMGPMAGWLMLLFIMVTLYDAQFSVYDTFIGRTTTDAIAVTRQRQGGVNISRILGRCPSLLIALPAIESTMGAGGAAIAGRPAPRAPARSPRLGA